MKRKENKSTDEKSVVTFGPHYKILCFQLPIFRYTKHFKVISCPVDVFNFWCRHVEVSDYYISLASKEAIQSPWVRAHTPSHTMGGGPRVVVSTAAFHAKVRGSVPGLGGLKETKLFLPHPRVKVSIVGSLRDREVACSASDRQGSNFESCVWRTVSSQSSHHPQEVLLAQFSLYVHKGGLKPDSFHFYHTP